ncbi:MAG: sugar ABC transporter permease [Bacilli bacterium]
MKTKQLQLDTKALLFLSPFLILYLVFTIFPIFKGIQMSLYKWTLIKKMDFVGLGNYTTMMKDPKFWEAVWNTSYFVILSTPTMLVLALLLAVIANRKTRLQKFYRSVFFLPSVLSVAVAAYLGLFTFQPYTGLVNNVLQLVGLLAQDKEIFWLSETQLVFFSVTLITLWWTVGVNFILYLSAMQDVPEDIYEAGKLDGANNSQLFWKITLPLLGPITKTIFMLQIIASYKVFLQFWIFTKGGPGTTTRPIIQYIYEEGFRTNNMGYAAAMSYVLFAILIILSAIQLKLNSRKGSA